MRPPRAHAAARPPARESNKGSGSQSLSLELRSRWSQGPDRLNAGEVRRQAGRLEEGPCLGTTAPRSERGAPRGALAGRQGPWRLVTPSVRPDTLTAGVMRPERTARRAATEGRRCHAQRSVPPEGARPPHHAPALRRSVRACSAGTNGCRGLRHTRCGWRELRGASPGAAASSRAVACRGAWRRRLGTLTLCINKAPPPLAMARPAPPACSQGRGRGAAQPAPQGARAGRTPAGARVAASRSHACEHIQGTRELQK